MTILGPIAPLSAVAVIPFSVSPIVPVVEAAIAANAPVKALSTFVTKALSRLHCAPPIAVLVSFAAAAKIVRISPLSEAIAVVVRIVVPVAEVETV
jgi:hypothetical protein